MSQDWIQTYTGKSFCFGDIKSQVVCIEDIAHALALTNRFGGHTIKPYSVAQHSVHVANRLPVEYRLQGLLHDSHEAYVGDNVRSLKQMVPSIKLIEEEIDKLIFSTFGVTPTPESTTAVKAADNFMLASEADSLLMGGCGWAKEWGIPEDGLMRVNAIDWKEAESVFLNMFYSLAG